MAKKENFSQEKANQIFESVALAAYTKFGFNPAAVLAFEMCPASDLYISPKLPGAKSWFYLKDPVASEAMIFNEKTGELLLVEDEESWSEKAFKNLSKISAADRKLWKELTGKELPAAKAKAKAMGKVPAKAKKAAPAKAKKAPAKKKTVAKKKAAKKAK